MESFDELRDHLWLISIRNCIQRCRLWWFGHVERMNNDSYVKKCVKVIVGRHRG